MERWVLLAAIGAIAQLIDGATGMAYGVTSATLMLMAGMAPLAVSASVHLAELPTTLLATLAHWRMGNLKAPLAVAIALPGAAGAWAGARLLGTLPVHAARVWVAAVLFVLGAWILLRHQVPGLSGKPSAKSPRRLLSRAVGRTLLAIVAGFVDAAAGGGWGPIMTSGFLAASRRQVRRVVAAVDAAEFAVALAASAAFLRHGWGQVQLAWVAALVAGGAAAAPAAAWLVSRMPARLLGTVVGGLVMVSHAPPLMQAAGMPAETRGLALAALVALWSACVARTARRRAPRPAPGAVARPARRAGVS